MSNGKKWSYFLYSVAVITVCSTSRKSDRQEVFVKKKTDARLTGFVVSTERTTNLLECSFKCVIYEKSKCTSFNFQKIGNPRHTCEMSNATKSTSSVVADDERFDYYVAEFILPELQNISQGERFVLNHTKIRSEQLTTIEKCIESCTRDRCCRSANFIKTEKTCEMFHANDYEMKGHRVPDITSDHFILETSVKKFSYSCRIMVTETRTNATNGTCGAAWFSSQDTSHYMKSDGNHAAFSSLTCCFWIKWLRGDMDTHFISYATKRDDNEFIVRSSPNVKLQVRNKASARKGINDISDGEWHSVCVTWNKAGGAYTIYMDGSVESTGNGIGTDEDIPGGGTWVLGQEQDSEGGGFDPKQMFIGQMAEVNIWDHVLPQEQIKMLSRSCGPVLRGNVKSWPDFIAGASDTIVMKESPQCCYKDDERCGTNN